MAPALGAIYEIVDGFWRDVGIFDGHRVWCRLSKRLVFHDMARQRRRTDSGLAHAVVGQTVDHRPATSTPRTAVCGKIGGLFRGCHQAMNFKVASEETSIPPETPTKRTKLWQHYKQSVP